MKDEIFLLCDRVRECAFALHRHLLADLLVDSRLFVELMACRGLNDDHVAQLLGYLRASRSEHGLLINFGAPKLEIRKYALSDPV